MALVFLSELISREEIITLLELTVKKEGKNTTCLCPFCDDTSGHLRIKENGLWHCVRCGEGGNSLMLYAKMRGISNSQAYHELCAAFVNNSTQDPQPLCKKEQELEITHIQKKDPMHFAETKNAQSLNKVYSALLDLLTLSTKHKADLTKRGINEKQLQELGIKSIPYKKSGPIIRELRNMGLDLAGVPGFYKRGSTYHMVCFCPGILIPIKDLEQNIVGFQIRVDEDYRNAQQSDGKKLAKYFNFSSAEKEGGCDSYKSAHYVGIDKNNIPETVYLTEGNLKADAASSISGKPFIAILGVQNYHVLTSAIEKLREGGTKRIVEALDMDKLTNPYVKKGLEKVKEIIENSDGVQYVSLTWNPEYKGIDDYLNREK